MAIPNAGLQSAPSMRTEKNMKLLCYVICYHVRVSRTFDIALCILHWQLSVDPNLSKLERKIMKI
jgi:hypothetical protein